MEPQSNRPDGAGGLLRIDLAALRANWAHVAARAAPARCAAVVKADAYGLGARRAAPALCAEGCRDFFVAHLGEALGLRPLLPAGATLYVLNGLQPSAEPACAGVPDVVPVLNGLGQIEAWARQAALRGSRLPAALQVDTGMSRLGLSPEDVESLARDLDLLRMFDLRLVMSHLACADEPGHPSNHEQLHAFRRLCALLPPAPTSLANSGGVMLGASFGHDLVRPGLALYGVSPTIAGDEGLRPVVRLDARVIQVRSVPVGTAVGYGGAWRAPSDARLATVAVGYADGWPRALGGVGAAFWHGLRLPIAGRVSMDSMTLDVSALPEGTLRLGSVVELIGPHQSLDEVAAQAGTIPYEILTRLGSRFARTYPGADGPQTAPEVRLT